MSSTNTLSTSGLRMACLMLIMLGLVATGLTLLQRIRAERSASTVEMVIDYQEAANLAGASGQPMPEVLAHFRKVGATAVALPEETLGGLLAQGKITVSVPDAPFASALTPPPGWGDSESFFLVRTTNQRLWKEILDGLRRVYPPESIGKYGADGILVRGSLDKVSDFGLGLSVLKVEAITRAGLRVVPRLRTSPHLDNRNIDNILNDVAALLPSQSLADTTRGVLIFDGDTVLGYRKSIPHVADKLTALGFLYGSVEFGKQKGDEQLGAKLKGRLVRVHSISVEELKTLAPAQAVSRFDLAVKDRNIRVLYIHLPPVIGVSPYAFVGAINSAIAGEHLRIARTETAQPFAPLTVPWPMLALLFTGAGASLLLWVLMVLPTDLPPSWVRIVLVKVVALLGLAVLLAWQSPDLGRVFFGLCAAVGFPMLALTWMYRVLRRLEDEPAVHPLLPGITVLIMATGLTLLGGLLIAATMAETSYLVKIGQFRGVKATLVLPLFFLLILVVTDGVARAGEGFTAYGARCRARISSFFRQPVYLWGITLALVGLVVLGLIMARSGNDTGLGASGMELRIRNLLEHWLVARPRTKEFAFGHPLLLLGFLAAARRQRALAMLCLLGGAVGLADVLNTYCHAHTPILLSLLRTANGLWIGLLIGAVLVLVAGRFLRPPVEELHPEISVEE